jgi:hypothetical protein
MKISIICLYNKNICCLYFIKVQQFKGGRTVKRLVAKNVLAEKRSINDINNWAPLVFPDLQANELNSIYLFVHELKHHIDNLSNVAGISPLPQIYFDEAQQPVNVSGQNIIISNDEKLLLQVAAQKDKWIYQIIRFIGLYIDSKLNFSSMDEWKALMSDQSTGMSQYTTNGTSPKELWAAALAGWVLDYGMSDKLSAYFDVELGNQSIGTTKELPTEHDRSHLKDLEYLQRPRKPKFRTI